MKDQSKNKYEEKLTRVFAALLTSVEDEYRSNILREAQRMAQLAAKISKPSPITIGIRHGQSVYETKQIVDSMPLLATAVTCSNDNARKRDIELFARSLACGAPIAGSPGVIDSELVEAIPIAEVAIATEVLNIDPTAGPEAKTIANSLKEKYSCATHVGYLGGCTKTLQAAKRAKVLKGDAMTVEAATKATLEPLNLSLTDNQWNALNQATSAIWNAFFQSDSDTDLDAAIQATTTIAQGYSDGLTPSGNLNDYLNQLSEQIRLAEEQLETQQTSYQNITCEATKLKLMTEFNKAPANLLLAIQDIVFDFSSCKAAAATCASIISALRVKGEISDSQSWSSFLQNALPTSIKEKFEL